MATRVVSLICSLDTNNPNVTPYEGTFKLIGLLLPVLSLFSYFFYFHGKFIGLGIFTLIFFIRRGQCSIYV